ncbi:hypothetical protein DL93DRAFT_1241531 [Clavulina sp. PMI_390]|nr:hypothetical protein DL93DRAFT_1241531 [Clavulina sp. PMI_390]
MLSTTSFLILAGSYTSNILTLKFTPGGNQTGALSLVGQSNVGVNPNPSWIAVHPRNKSILFSTNEDEPGFVTSYLINPKTSLVTPVDQQASNGTDPANLLPLDEEVIVPNYTSGDVESHILAPDGVHFTGYGNQIHFNGSGPNPSRQTGPHPHQAFLYGEEVLMPDLGSDKVWRLGRANSTRSGTSVGQWQINGYIQQPSGSGPRHLQTIGNTLYTIHELANTVTQQIIPAKPGADFPALIANVSTLPPASTLPANSEYTAAELLLFPASASTTTRYLLASNRNIGTGVNATAGDSLAILATAPKLHVVKQVWTGLEQIRGTQLSPDGKYVIAAGLVGGGVAMFEFVETVTKSGAVDVDLVLRGRCVDAGCQSISSFVWL